MHDQDTEGILCGCISNADCFLCLFLQGIVSFGATVKSDVCGCSDQPCIDKARFDAASGRTKAVMSTWASSQRVDLRLEVLSNSYAFCTLFPFTCTEGRILPEHGSSLFTSTFCLGQTNRVSDVNGSLYKKNGYTRRGDCSKSWHVFALWLEAKEKDYKQEWEVTTGKRILTLEVGCIKHLQVQTPSRS